MLRALLFDFDGLLIDTESQEYRTWAEVYERHGHVLTVERWSAAIGTIGGFDPEAHLAELGVALDAGAVAERDLRNRALCEAAELCAGVAELLDQARQRGVATAVVSSSSRAWIHGLLEPRGLLDRFDAIVCADGDPARAKPRPTLYLEALARLSVGAHEAVAFEDSPNGIRAAKAAEIFCVAVPNKVTAVLDLSQADVVAASLLDVPLESLATMVRA